MELILQRGDSLINARVIGHGFQLGLSLFQIGPEKDSLFPGFVVWRSWEVRRSVDVTKREASGDREFQSSVYMYQRDLSVFQLTLREAIKQIEVVERGSW